MQKIILFFLSITAVFLNSACDGGLEPVNNKTYIRGSIEFKGKFPPTDSLLDLRVVAFKKFPPDNFISEILSGDALYSPETIVPVNESASFELEVPFTPVLYKYIALAQRYGSALEWRSVGVYTLTNNQDKPDSLLCLPGQSYNIKINVDFDHLPPQPF